PRPALQPTAESCQGAIIRMDAEKLEHYRRVLAQQLRQRTETARENQSDALEIAGTDDGVKDVADQSVKDLSQEIEYRLGERESQLIADIDQALMRIEEGTYGVCARCGEGIPESRIEGLHPERYDAAG